MPTHATAQLLPPETRGHRVRLGTLVNLRWLAVLGQASTVVVAVVFLDLQFELAFCAAVITAAALANLAYEAQRPANTRLSDRGAFFFLLFDLLQLTALLFFTGGLNNPFALLFLAPVTIAATALSLRSTMTLGLIGIALITLLAGYHLPLRLPDGMPLTLPTLQLVGFWLAIVVGMIFLAGFAFRLTLETQRMSNALLATQTALAREQKLHDLGGVVAAAAHELGTPLSTIKLTSAELEEDLSDQSELLEDVRLIRSQADRCHEILRSMGQTGKSDRQIAAAPFETVVNEAAAPHADRGISLTCTFAVDAETEGQDYLRMPHVLRRPELIHGLRNVIQNAVDFAASEVWIDGTWSADRVTLKIVDDGPGFPPEVLHRLGDPFLRSRRREGYDGMGLGLFIAKTLLARTGGSLRFSNRSRDGRIRRGTRSGAMIEITWPRSEIAAPQGRALGENALLLS